MTSALKLSVASALIFSLLKLPALSHAQAQVSAVPSAMNFQGRLATPSGNPVPDGTYSIRFALWNIASGGTAVTNEKYNKTVANVAVKNGTFAVTLDAFPADTFNGNLWLEIKIGNDAALAPRTPLVSVPYAMKSDLALTVPDGSLTAAKFATGVLGGQGWLLSGNAGTTASQFLGTTDAKPLVFKTNSAARLTLNDTEAAFTGNVTLGENKELFFADNGQIRSMDNNHRILLRRGANKMELREYGDLIFSPGAIYGEETNKVVMKANGYVGVGIRNPQAKLHVAKSLYDVGVFVGDTDPNFNYTTAFQTNFLAPAIHAWFEEDYTRVFSVTEGGSGYFAGSVGIGTATPQQKLSVAGGLVIDQNGENGNALNANGAEGNGLTFGSNSGEGIASTRLEGSANRYGLDLYTGHNKRLSITNDGNVGIGTDSPSYFLDVQGDIGCNDIFSSSDARYKINIAPLPTALDTILNLRGVSYDWNRAAWQSKNFSAQKRFGFIAQEIEIVLPSLVRTDRNGFKAVNYQGVIPVLVEAVKTLNARTVIQQKQNDAKDAKIAEMEARLERLEAAQRAQK